MFYAPGQDVQRPTHSRLHVRDARDAQTVFEAVRRGILKPVSRRLNEIERSMFIQSGSIFVWEESDDELGLKRWTDGRVWSQSRLREPYLFYDEKLPDDPGSSADSQSSRVFRFVDGSSRGNIFDRSTHRPLGLVKQAYSAYVLTPGTNTRMRKWHLTAYFTYDDLQSLPSVDSDPILRSVTVPAGVYRSGKARSRNSDLDGSASTSEHPIGALAATSPLQTVPQYSVVAPNAQNPSQRVHSAHQALPPLHTAVESVPSFSGSTSPQREARWSEDQRMIQMLNSRHVR